MRRSVVESLAEGFAHALRGRGGVAVVHVVGGGAQNALLCQALTDRIGLRVRRLVADTHALLTYTPGGLR